MELQTARRLAHAAFYVAWAVAIVGATSLSAWAGEARPLLTIADGPVQVLRGAQRFDAAEGLALADDDIVRTGITTRVTRIEFGDGRALDLGPATQVLLVSTRAAQAQGFTGASAVALQGWFKLSAGAAAARLVLPHAVALGAARGVVLAHVAADGAALAFAESGGLTLQPRAAGTGAEILLREGETWSRDAASGAVRVSARTAGLRDMPRALADTLPRRAARFDGRAVAAGDGAALEADDLAPWQRAEPQLLALLHPPRALAAPRSVAKRKTRVMPAMAAAPRAAAPIALPPTLFLATEPVATVNLPMVSSLGSTRP
jgi:hypothetical protein